jgi:hypothetical protein
MSEVKKVLWTGGWDSTFRVLYLVVVEKCPVQTCYIIDPFRWSLVHEFKAMSNIKRALKQKYPELSALLLPTLYFDKTDVGENLHLSSCYEGLKERLGGQYEWLSIWADQFGLSEIELVIERSDSVVGCRSVISNYLSKDEKGYRVIDAKFSGTPVYDLFHYFVFAITDIYKVDMRRIAAEHDFADILNLSWFCHRPTFFSKPCGTCNPCKNTYVKGLGDRLGVYGKCMYILNHYSNPKNYFDKKSRTFSFLKSMKNSLARKIAS